MPCFTWCLVLLLRSYSEVHACSSGILSASVRRSSLRKNLTIYLRVAAQHEPPIRNRVG